ncbi:MAG: hypothetical protein ACLRWQ_20850 [Flavonifractor plautii]
MVVKTEATDDSTAPAAKSCSSPTAPPRWSPPTSKQHRHYAAW